MSHSHPRLAQWLLSTPVSALPTPHHGTIFNVSGRDTMAHVLGILVKRNILSTPVLDGSFPPKVQGLVDMTDIAEYALRIIEETTSTIGPESNFKTALEQSERFYTTPIDEVINFSKRDPLTIVQSTSTLAELLDLLSRHGLHRVLVSDPQHNFINMITQSAFLNFLMENSQCFPELLHCTIRDIKPNLDGVVSIAENRYALDAFRLMRTHGVSAVAVTNSAGVISGTISVKDLRLISVEIIIPRLFVSCLEFVQRAKVEAKQPDQVVVCQPHDTFQQVLDTLYRSKLHRVWVVDSAGRPQGVIALRDILFFILVKAAHKV